ncbi:MAG: hypothetical protein VKL20_08125 [Synechocystis sp.]|nr:hypothetical protein [Synechocystis sp.]
MTLAQAQENPNVLQTVSLLTAYCFDLRGLAPTQIMDEWLRTFSALWIRLAVIEALYLGRYKAISVEHLLQFWEVKGQPNLHFSAEFEQMVSQRLPKSLSPSFVVLDGDRPLGSSVDKGKPLKVPGVIKQANHWINPDPDSLPSPVVTSSVSGADDRDLPQTGTDTHSPDPVPAPPKAIAQPTRKFSPSIEQFIPIAAESDLLSKLQSVLHQSSLPVQG